jgi:putative chitinase
MFEGMIRGSFRKKKLADYFNDTKSDPIMARNIINGTRKGEKLPDRAVEIANAYKAFHGDLLLAAA